MLAGMGGVSYHRLVAAVSDAGGIGTLGASTMRTDELPIEMAKVRELTAKPFGVDLLTALPGPGRGRHRRRHQGRREHLRRRARRAPRRRSTPSTTPTSSSGRCAARFAMPSPPSPAGATSSSPRGPRPAGTPAPWPRWPSCPRWSTRWPSRSRSSPPAGSSTVGGSLPSLALGADGVWIGTRFIATPEARSVDGYKEALIDTAEDGTVITPRLHRQDLPGGAQRVDPALRRAPRRAPAFPAQAIASAQAGVNHLGAPDGTAVDPSASSSRAARASARSRSWSRRASSSAASSTRPNRLSPGLRNTEPVTIHCVPRPRRPLLAARSLALTRSHRYRVLQ